MLRFPEGSPTAGERTAVVLVLLLAAALRFVDLDRDFAFGGPNFDERHNFIQPVHWMWERGTADPHVYSGYPGFFNWLIFGPVTLARQQVGLEAAYVAARAVVAAFGVLGVALVWALGRSLFGPLPAIAGAALAACSRVGLREAQQISPDVVVAAALVGILLCLRRRDAGRAEDLAAGALLGLATAVKYTGLMLTPALVIGLVAGGRPRRVLPALAAAAFAFTLAAPYAVFQENAERGSGLAASVVHYFRPDRLLEEGGADPEERLGLDALLPLLRHDVGAPALVLAGLSLVLWRRRWVLAAPAGVLAASTAVMAFATLTFPRHALVPLAATAVLVMGGVAGAMARLPARWARPAGAGLAIAVLLVPAGHAGSFLARLLQPSGARLAQSWLAERLDGPARVATSLYGLPLPQDRFEVRSGLVLQELPIRFLDAFDVIVARETELSPPPRWTEAARFATPETPAPLLVLRPPRRGRGRPVPPPAAASASSSPGRAALAVDGDPATAWSGGPGPGWIEVRWDQPVEVARVEVTSGSPDHWPQRWRLLGGSGGAPEPVQAPRLRPRTGQIEGLPHGQIFVLTPPRSLDSVRIVRRRGGDWSVAEIRIYGEAASGADR